MCCFEEGSTFNRATNTFLVIFCRLCSKSLKFLIVTIEEQGPLICYHLTKKKKNKIYFLALLPWCRKRNNNFSKIRLSTRYQTSQNKKQFGVITNHLKVLNQLLPTTKLLQWLLAIIGVLPSGLWQWIDSGTPFTLEEDPPCGGIYGSR